MDNRSSGINKRPGSPLTRDPADAGPSSRICKTEEGECTDATREEVVRSVVKREEEEAAGSWRSLHQPPPEAPPQPLTPSPPPPFEPAEPHPPHVPPPEPSEADEVGASLAGAMLIDAAMGKFAKAEHQFVPKCSHRHTLVRAPRASGTAAEEPLVCDGPCGREIPPGAPRWSCFPCDFDLCELCLLGKCGGACYLELLTKEEERALEATSRLGEAEERAKLAEAKLAAAEKRAASAASGGAASAREREERRAAEARAAAAEERASAAEAEVERLHKEVLERRQRSKASLDKMFAAQKERDDVRAAATAAAEAAASALDDERALTAVAQRQLDEAHAQLACVRGEPDALGALTSHDDAEALESRCLEGLVRVRARRCELAEAAERERQKRLDCVVCLMNSRTVAYGPCGHIACCRECAPKMELCPLCKRGVAHRIPVYLP